MEQHGIEVVCYEDAECIAMMERFIADNPKLWAEDIGEL
jgi:cytosine deaminase